MAKTRSTKTGKTASRSGAKKSTRGRKKATSTLAYELPGGFWRQIMAILMLFLAVVLIFAWMGDGGELLNTKDNIMVTTRYRLTPRFRPGLILLHILLSS